MLGHISTEEQATYGRARLGEKDSPWLSSEILKGEAVRHVVAQYARRVAAVDYQPEDQEDWSEVNAEYDYPPECDLP